MAVVTATGPVGSLRGVAAGVWKPIVLGVFAVWLISVGARHEAWADEAQAWLIARDSSLGELLWERVRYEGTPGLWHLVLWGAIRCGLPFTQLYLVSVASAVIGAAVVLWRAPFPALLRVSLIGSHYFAYQYSVVARSYALDLVLVPVAAALFAQRWRRPIAYGAVVGVMANANAHGFLVAAVLGCEFLWAAWRRGGLGSRAVLGGLAVALLCGLFAVAVAWQPADNFFLAGERDPASAAAMNLVREAFIDRPLFWSREPPGPMDALLGLVLSSAVLVPSFLAFRRAGLLPLAVGLFGLLIGFSAFGYSSPWHAGILFLGWIFCLWISWPHLTQTRALARGVVASLAIVTGVQMVEAANSGRLDLSVAYSAGRAAAARLADLRESDPTARVAVVGFKAVSVRPYFADDGFIVHPDGVVRPAYYAWDAPSAAPLRAMPRVAQIAAESHSDHLLVSISKRGFPGVRAFEAEARQAGYRKLELFPGALIWKGYEREDDSLLLLRREPSAR